MKCVDCAVELLVVMIAVVEENGRYQGDSVRKVTDAFLALVLFIPSTGLFSVQVRVSSKTML